jgi:MFS transporter, DHA1 family, inner membrane transport protein
MATLWSGVAAVFAAGVCAAYGLLKVSAAGPALRGALGLDLAGMGLLMSIYTLATVSLAIPAGLWIRRAGARRAALAGLGLLALGSALGALGGDAALVGASRVVEGGGFVLVTVAGPALVAAYAAPAQRVLALAVWAIWLPVGGLVALALAPVLLSTGGWPALWWVGAGGALICAAILAGKPDPAPAVLAAGSARGVRRGGAWLGALFACFTFQLYAVVTFTPTVLVERADLSIAQASRAAALTLAGSALAGWVAGRAMHAGLPPRSVVIGGFVLLGLMLPLLPVAIGTQWPGAALLFAHGLAGGAVATAIYAWAPQLVPPAGMGPAMGLLMTGNGLGILLGPPVVGALVESGAPWTHAALVPALVALLGALAAWRLRGALPAGAPLP